jgi:hypothetical protein
VFNYFFSELFHYLVTRVCFLVARVPGYRSRGSGSDSLHYQIFSVVGLERGTLILVSTTEELERKMATQDSYSALRHVISGSPSDGVLHQAVT